MLIGELCKRVRGLIPELAKFGAVGAAGAVVDLGGTAALHGLGHVGPLTSKAVAVTVAMMITYTGNRFWTFRYRANPPPLRQGSVFVALNLVGLLIAEIVIAIVAYGLGYSHNQVAYNAASVVGTGLGTIFRYFTYKKWVFLNPDIPNDPGIPVLVPRSRQDSDRPGTLRGFMPGPCGAWRGGHRGDCGAGRPRRRAACGARARPGRRQPRPSCGRGTGQGRCPPGGR